MLPSFHASNAIFLEHVCWHLAIPHDLPTSLPALWQRVSLLSPPQTTYLRHINPLPSVFGFKPPDPAQMHGAQVLRRASKKPPVSIEKRTFVPSTPLLLIAIKLNFIHRLLCLKIGWEKNSN